MEKTGQRYCILGYKFNTIIFVVLLLLVLILTGPVSAEETKPGKLKIFTSIEPQVFFVKKVGGSYVDAEAFLPEGQSPHSFEPLPRQVASLSKARIFFRIGMEYEQRVLEKVSAMFPALAVVDTKPGIQKNETENQAENKKAGHHNEHDRHTWLDPLLVREQAGIIYRALAETDPVHENEYKANLSAFQHELDQLDSRIAALLKPFRGKAVYVYHPVLGHFTRRYGLEQVAVEREGKEPSARELAALIEKMRRDSAQVLFVQPEHSPAIIKTLEKTLACRAVSINPLSGDYLQNLEKIAEKIKQALSDS